MNLKNILSEVKETLDKKKINENDEILQFVFKGVRMGMVEDGALFISIHVMDPYFKQKKRAYRALDQEFRALGQETMFNPRGNYKNDGLTIEKRGLSLKAFQKITNHDVSKWIKE